MRRFASVPSSLRLVSIAVGLVIALGLSLALGLSVSRVMAQDPPTTISACVNKDSGVLRIVASAGDCRQNETFLSWQSGFDLAAVEARITTLEGQVTALQTENATQQATIDSLTTEVGTVKADVTALDAQVPECLTTGQDGSAHFTGCNVQIRNGLGRTDTTNGTGNLIVGYNESIGDTRTGSHNLVVGQYHTYSSYGGLVAGFDNTISNPFASVSGGGNNTASGFYASVSGGVFNTASGSFASVSGGHGNIASGPSASVSGGGSNTASGSSASVSGGGSNTASGGVASVSGGFQRSAPTNFDWAAGSLFENQ
jgi:hypothetical protein